MFWLVSSLAKLQTCTRPDLVNNAAAAVYELVEYVGTSGSPLTPADIAKFPKPPSSVRLTWVIAFVGDATSTTTPSGKFACTGGSFCSGNNLDQTLVAALKGVSNAQVSTACQPVYAAIVFVCMQMPVLLALPWSLDLQW